MKFIIIGIALIVILVLVFIRSNKQRITEAKSNNQEYLQVQEKEKKENPFDGLRKQALSVTQEMIGLKPSENDNKNTVYGIIIDWNMKSGIATIVAYKTGDASIYFSSGGGFIGGYAHSTVVEAAKTLVEYSNSFINKSIYTEDTSLPEKENVKFFLLTDKGKYSHQELYKNLENSNSDWSKLFGYANNLITAYREAQTNK